MDFSKLKEMAIYDLTQYRQLADSSSAEDRQRAALIKKKLAQLPEKEQAALEWFYINRNHGRADRIKLQAALNMENSVLYRFKDTALLHYYTALVCVLHSAE